MPRYTTVLLDADNTLYDFDAAERKALHRVLVSRGYTPDPHTVNAYLNINNALWRAFARGEVTQEFLLVERFRLFEAEMGGSHDPVQFNADYVTQLASNADLIPGAETFCRRLHQAGCRLAIVTNGSAAAQRGRFHRSPLKEWISHLFISQELGVSKPSPDFFDIVCRTLELSVREDAIILGDNLDSDILGGNRSQIDTIWYNPRALSNPGPAVPTFTVTDFDQAIRIILSC